MMFYNITIFKEGDKHYANIYIDGFQTMQVVARLIQTEMYVSLALINICQIIFMSHMKKEIFY